MAVEVSWLIWCSDSCQRLHYTKLRFTTPHYTSHTTTLYTAPPIHQASSFRSASLPLRAPAKCGATIGHGAFPGDEDSEVKGRRSPTRPRPPLRAPARSCASCRENWGHCFFGALLLGVIFWGPEGIASTWGLLCEPWALDPPNHTAPRDTLDTLRGDIRYSAVENICLSDTGMSRLPQHRMVGQVQLNTTTTTATGTTPADERDATATIFISMQFLSMLLPLLRCWYSLQPLPLPLQSHNKTKTSNHLLTSFLSSSTIDLRQEYPGEHYDLLRHRAGPHNYDEEPLPA